MTPGDVYNDSKFKKAYEKLRDVYGSLGYFQWTGGTQRKPDPEKKVVDITVKMEEDKQYFLGRINFTGNDSTRDKVIRREIYMNEGDVFNTEALKMSIKRVNQLGYFKPMEGAPDIRPSETADNKVDVTFKVEEQNRNQFTFGGGVSGLEGAFLNASLLDHELPRRRRDLPDLRADRQAHEELLARRSASPTSSTAPSPPASTSSGARSPTYSYAQRRRATRRRAPGRAWSPASSVGKWSRAFLNYTYEVIKLSEADPADLTDPFYPGAGAASTTGPSTTRCSTGDFGKRTESRITPNLVCNTVDNPFTPRAGMRHTATLHVRRAARSGARSTTSGPTSSRSLYLPVRPQDVARACAPRRPASSPSATPQVLPLLPALLPRRRDAGPRLPHPLDRPHRLAGTRARRQQVRPLQRRVLLRRVRAGAALLFFDAGQAYLEGQDFSFDDFRISTGAEVRFIMPVLNVPFRLIYAMNPNRTPYEKLYVPYSTFKFAVGTTF